MRPVATSGRCRAGPQPPPAAESSRPGIYGRRWMLFTHTHIHTQAHAHIVTHRTYTHTRAGPESKRPRATASVRTATVCRQSLASARAPTNRTTHAARAFFRTFYTRARARASVFPTVPAGYQPRFHRVSLTRVATGFVTRSKVHHGRRMTDTAYRTRYSTAENSDHHTNVILSSSW